MEGNELLQTTLNHSSILLRQQILQIQIYFAVGEFISHRTLHEDFQSAFVILAA